MTVDINSGSEKRQLYRAVFIPFIFGLFMVLSFVLETGMDWDFHTAGINPRNVQSILGVFTVIFVHGSWSHLINNLISFELLGTLLFLLYKEIALKIFIISWIVNGIILWLIGRDAWHIGASGLIYSIAFFLFFSGLIRKHTPLIAVSLVVAFLYGSMVWHIFPWQLEDPVSWEGHLAGGVTGLFLSMWFKNEGPQKPVETEEQENQEEDLENYSEYDESPEQNTGIKNEN